MTAVDAINAWLHRQHVRTGTSTASFMSARAATLERSAAVALGIAVVCWKIEIDLYFLLMYGVAAALCFFLFRAPRARRAGCCCACAVAAAALPLLLLGGPLAIAAVTDLQRDPPSALHDLLSRADVLMSCLPSTEETRGLIGAAELATLPDGAIVVNVGRGDVIDETALFTALQVTPPEPHLTPPDST